MKRNMTKVLVASCIAASLAARGASAPVSPVVQKLRHIAQQQAIEPRSPQYLLLIDAQARLTADEVQALHTAVGRDLGVPLRLQTLAPAAAPATVAAAVAWRAAADTNCVAAVVLLQQKEALPGLLLALDSRWALVNVDALAAPTGAAVSGRVRRQVLRGFGTLFGTGFVQDPGEADMMRPVVQGPAELDAMPEALSSSNARRFLAVAQGFGLLPVTRLWYRQLVVMGRMPPVDPKVWPTWEARHKKTVAETLKGLGFEPEAAMAELRQAAAAGETGTGDEGQ